MPNLQTREAKILYVEESATVDDLIDAFEKYNLRDIDMISFGERGTMMVNDVSFEQLEKMNANNG